MRKIFSFLLLFCVSIAAFSQVTKQTACELAKSYMDDSSGEKYDYYISKNPVLYRLPEITTGTMQLCWLVFVDMEPFGNWDHPCKYVYVKYNTAAVYHTIDTVSPPSNVSLEPISKPNRYGTAANMKPYVPNFPSNAPNMAAEHTYAVILNGGASAVQNREAYWNDCSFIYKTLRFRYDVPKTNIKVIMSDGTDEAEDLNLASGSFISSPLDLDGDNQPDIDYAATKENLQAVFSSLAQTLTDEDHLLLFVTDHGGYDTSGSYLYLWNKEQLYANELAAYLEPVNAGFISIVMGQCCSGGFIEPLKKPNRIISTACNETEFSFVSTSIPYNEFLYRWTSAINGYDAYGNEVNVNENISLLDAHAYAAKNDFYANGGTRYVTETPMLNYFTNSVACDLSFANIPPVVYLCFDKYKDPVASTQTTIEYDPDSDNGNDFSIMNPTPFWCSPYIWLRNTNDGIENQETESLVFEDGKPIYMYTKVRNKGVKSYSYNGEGIEVQSYWAKSSFVISESDWKGYSTNTMSKGGSFSSADVDTELLPGQSTIIMMRKFFTDKAFKTMEGSSDLCVLAFLKEADTNETFPVDSNYIAATWGTDKLAQSNVLILYERDTTDTSITCVDFTNISSAYGQYSLKLISEEDLVPLFSEADLSLKVSSDLITSWNNGGSQGDDIEVDINTPGVFKLKSNASSLSGFRMTPHQSGSVDLVCNFFANSAITEKKMYDVNVALVNDSTGQCLGGETFRIIQDPRPAMNPIITTSTNSGRIVLQATNVSENVIYRWYDGDGNLVGTGQSFNVPAGRPASEYQVKVEAYSDGAISYSSPVLVGYSSILSVDSRSNSDLVRVNLTSPTTGNATLRLTSSTGNAPTTDYSVESGASSYDIPATNLPSGIYQLTLIEDGSVTGTMKFTK